jgi:hypothetical protein
MSTGLLSYTISCSTSYHSNTWGSESCPRSCYPPPWAAPTAFTVIPEAADLVHTAAILHHELLLLLSQSYLRQRILSTQLLSSTMSCSCCSTSYISNTWGSGSCPHGCYPPPWAAPAAITVIPEAADLVHRAAILHHELLLLLSQ